MPHLNDGVHVQEYVYDFAVDGGATGDIELATKVGYKLLPEGAIVKNVVAKVITACTSGGSATLTAGNADDRDGYLASIAVASLSEDAVFSAQSQTGALLWDNTNDANLVYNVTGDNPRGFSVTIGTAALTAGKVIFLVEYYYPSLLD